MLEPVELRSDTFTRPTPGMRQAIAEAEVGDDVWGEDPTVNALEARAAALVGKEAAIYCVTGTMANSIAMRLHAGGGDEILMHELSHPFHHEAGSPAGLWGLTVRPLPGERGLIDPAALKIMNMKVGGQFFVPIQLSLDDSRLPDWLRAKTPKEKMRQAADVGLRLQHGSRGRW